MAIRHHLNLCFYFAPFYAKRCLLRKKQTHCWTHSLSLLVRPITMFIPLSEVWLLNRLLLRNASSKASKVFNMDHLAFLSGRCTNWSRSSMDPHTSTMSSTINYHVTYFSEVTNLDEMQIRNLWQTLVSHLFWNDPLKTLYDRIVWIIIFFSLDLVPSLVLYVLHSSFLTVSTG